MNKSLWVFQFGDIGPRGYNPPGRLGVVRGPLRQGNLFDGSIFWSMPWKMWPEADLKHLKHKNIFWGSGKSIWGPKRPISVSYELNLAI